MLYEHEPPSSAGMGDAQACARVSSATVFLAATPFADIRRYRVRLETLPESAFPKPVFVNVYAPITSHDVHKEFFGRGPPHPLLPPTPMTPSDDDDGGNSLSLLYILSAVMGAAAVFIGCATGVFYYCYYIRGGRRWNQEINLSEMGLNPTYFEPLPPTPPGSPIPGSLRESHAQGTPHKTPDRQKAALLTPPQPGIDATRLLASAGPGEDGSGVKDSGGPLGTSTGHVKGKKKKNKKKRVENVQKRDHHEDASSGPPAMLLECADNASSSALPVLAVEACRRAGSEMEAVTRSRGGEMEDVTPSGGGEVEAVTPSGGGEMEACDNSQSPVLVVSRRGEDVDVSDPATADTAAAPAAIHDGVGSSGVDRSSVALIPSESEGRELTPAAAAASGSNGVNGSNRVNVELLPPNTSEDGVNSSDPTFSALDDSGSDSSAVAHGNASRLPLGTTQNAGVGKDWDDWDDD
eukprot:gene17938-21364_t